MKAVLVYKPHKFLNSIFHNKSATESNYIYGDVMKLKYFPPFVLLVIILAACQVTPAPQSGDTLFEDDFSSGLHTWTRHANDGGIMDHDGGGFRIQVRDTGVMYWSSPGQTFQDVRIEVDTLKIAGPVQNKIGVICRQVDSYNFYFFVISTDGYYAIGKMKDNQSMLIDQAAMKYSVAIEQGVSINRIRAECVGSTLRLYVNDAPVALAQDLDFAQGDVGLLAGTFDDANVDVLFDNFSVIVP